MKRTKIAFNLKGLEELQKQMGDTYKARVGVLGSHAARTGNGPLNNAEIGLIQMFGSLSRNIPARDFLLMPITLKEKELIAAMRGPQVKNLMRKQDYKGVFEFLGREAERIVHEAFATGGFGTWAPNAPATIDKKGSNKPLIDERQLDRSITSEVVKKGEAGYHSAGGGSI